MALVVFWRCPERLKEVLHAEQRKAALNGRVLTLNGLVTQLVAQVLGVPPQGCFAPGDDRGTRKPRIARRRDDCTRGPIPGSEVEADRDT
jgi:hypothetical protein